MATTTDVSPEDAEVESQWYHALFEEDCVVVIKLLDEHPKLLMVGWKSEPSRQVRGRKRREGEGWTESSWKGRTALHVAASRGCVKLIIQALRRCNLDGFSEVNEAYERSLLYYTSADTHDPNLDGKGSETILSTRELTETRPGPLVLAEGKGPITADSSLDDSKSLEVTVETPAGQPEIAESEGSYSGVSPHDAIPKSDRQKGEEGGQAAETSGSASKAPDGKLQKTVSINVARSADEKRNEKTHPLVAQKSVARTERQRTTKKKGRNSDAISRDYISDVDHRRLLLAKDGESGLDAIAMAVLHGNKEVINLLRYCAGKLNDRSAYHENSRSAENASLKITKYEKKNREKRKLLRQVTVAAVMAFIELVEPYYEDESEDEDESVDSDRLPQSPSEGPEFGPPPSTAHRRAFAKYIKVHGEQTLDTRAFDEYLSVHDASTTFSSDALVRGHWVFKEYFENRDFNFLPPEEYLFHLQCGSREYRQIEVFKTLWLAVRSWPNDDSLWRYLLELKDGQGRPPFHVAVEESLVEGLLESLKLMTSDTEALILAMSAPDEAGRTPVHRAAATGSLGSIETIIEYGGDFDKVTATFHASWDSAMDDCGSSRAHDFLLCWKLPHTPLHAALLNKNISCAELLLKQWRKHMGDMTYRCSDELLLSTDPLPCAGWYGEVQWMEWDLVEFACLVGAPPSFMEHFKNDLAAPRLRKRERYLNGESLMHHWHPLHLAASLGRYDLVRFFIDNPNWDPFIEDFEGNSALHHAMRVREFELVTHLLDFVNAEHYSLSKHNKASRVKEEILDANRIAERQGCINLLLQAGCNVFKTNDKNQIPYPTGSLMDNKFLSWWYDKQEKEFSGARNNLNFATNAIAVTATLVVTASYVGPLQPPLGYDSNHIQYTNAWVSVFIVCDTISFYLAIIAITLSLIPSLPMPQQAMLEELERTRETVIMAVGILFPSIFFIFVAFACSSISVMSGNITSEVGGIFTIVSTLIGILLCTSAFVLFSIRFLAFIFPKNSSIRYVYNLSFGKKLFKSVSGRERKVLVLELKRGPDSSTDSLESIAP